MKHTIKVQFDVTEDNFKAIEALMKESGVATKRDLFNNALTLLEWAIKEIKSGRIIASVDEKEDKYKELVMPILTMIPKPL